MQRILQESEMEAKAHGQEHCIVLNISSDLLRKTIRKYWNLRDPGLTSYGAAGNLLGKYKEIHHIDYK